MKLTTLCSLVLLTTVARAQELRDVNLDLPGFVGSPVVLSGTLVADDSGLSLWTSHFHAGRNNPFRYTHRVVLTDGGGLPPDPELDHYAEVEVSGMVSVAALDLPAVGVVFVAEVAVDGYAVLAPPPPFRPVPSSVRRPVPTSRARPATNATSC